MMKRRRRTSCVQELECNVQGGKGEWRCASCQTLVVGGPSAAKRPRSEGRDLIGLGVRPRVRRSAEGGMGALGFSAYSKSERSWVRGLDAHVIFTDRDGEPYPAGLRQDDTITSFHIFPRTEKELEDNFILWDAVNNEGVFERRHPFQEDVCALLLPKKLYTYLRCVQRKHMAATILEILSDIINFDEVQGAMVRQELAPSLWQELSAKMRTAQSHNSSEFLPSAFLLDELLEDQLVPHCRREADQGELSPFNHWRISVKAVVPVQRVPEPRERELTDLMTRLRSDFELCRRLFSTCTPGEPDLVRAVFEGVIVRSGVLARKLDRHIDMAHARPFSELHSDVIFHHVLPRLLVSDLAIDTSASHQRNKST